MRFQPLEKLINLHDGYARSFKIDNLQLLLRQESGRLCLIEAHCPHRGHPLASGSLVADSIECPLHGYCFSTLNGALKRGGQEACRPLRVYDIVYEGTELGVMLDDDQVTG